MTQWILLGIAIAGIIYNIIQTRIVLQNDVKHLEKSVTEVKARLDRLIFHFIGDEQKPDP